MHLVSSHLPSHPDGGTPFFHGPSRPRVAAAEIIAFDNVIVVYKFVGDLYFYATASAEENEVILAQVLTTFVDTISLLLTCVTPAQRALCQACAACVRPRRGGGDALGLLVCPSHPRRAATWRNAARWRTWTLCS